MSRSEEKEQHSKTDFAPLPPAPPSHVVGQGYSSSRPVPTVQSYKDTQARNEADAQQYAQIVEARRAETEERERMSQQAQDEEKAKSDDKATAEAPPNDGEEKNVLKSNKDKKDNVSGGQPPNEKEKMMQQMNANKSQLQCTSSRIKADISPVRPTDRFKQAEKGQRRVRDPITGTEIIVKDTDPKGE